MLVGQKWLGRLDEITWVLKLIDFSACIAHAIGDPVDGEKDWCALKVLPSATTGPPGFQQTDLEITERIDIGVSEVD